MKEIIIVYLFCMCVGIRAPQCPWGRGSGELLEAGSLFLPSGFWRPIQTVRLGGKSPVPMGYSSNTKSLGKQFKTILRTQSWTWVNIYIFPRHVCLCTMCICDILRPEEGAESSGIRVTDSRELSCGCSKLNPSSLGKAASALHQWVFSLAS